MANQEQLAGVKEGDILAGKYRVDRVLGVGGMGVVVAAHHLQLDDRVAIKFLLAETLNNKDAVARFSREARAAVKIKSEHVARVTDVGTLDNGAPYMVMEYLEGGDLAAWIEQRGALPVQKATDFVLQACEAIAEAHALGIVHRDLKPANLFVAQLTGGGETVKVLDFGISKLTGFAQSGGQSSATKTSALMGSPLYMSPEQMQSSKDVDARGDVWALGVILYELVTGVSPFTADSMPELILKIMNSPPAPLASHRPDAPPELEAVILRCLEKDRTKRYQSIGELAVALLPFGSGRARASVDRISQVMQAAGMATGANLQLPMSAAQQPGPGAGTAASFGGTVPGSRTTPTALVVGATLTALVVGAVVIRSAISSSAGAPSAAVQASAAEKPPEPTPRATGPEQTAEPTAPPAVAPAAPAPAPTASSEPVQAPPSPSKHAAHTPAGAGLASTTRVVTPKKTSPQQPAPALPAPPTKAPATSLIDDRR